MITITHISPVTFSAKRRSSNPAKTTQTKIAEGPKSNKLAPMSPELGNWPTRGAYPGIDQRAQKLLAKFPQARHTIAQEIISEMRSAEMARAKKLSGNKKTSRKKQKGLFPGDESAVFKAMQALEFRLTPTQKAEETKPTPNTKTPSTASALTTAKAETAKVISVRKSTKLTKAELARQKLVAEAAQASGVSPESLKGESNTALQQHIVNAQAAKKQREIERAGLIKKTENGGNGYRIEQRDNESDLEFAERIRLANAIEAKRFADDLRARIIQANTKKGKTVFVIPAAIEDAILRFTEATAAYDNLETFNGPTDVMTSIGKIGVSLARDVISKELRKAKAKEPGPTRNWQALEIVSSEAKRRLKSIEETGIIGAISIPGSTEGLLIVSRDKPRDEIITKKHQRTYDEHIARLADLNPGKIVPDEIVLRLQKIRDLATEFDLSRQQKSDSTPPKTDIMGEVKTLREEIFALLKQHQLKLN